MNLSTRNLIVFGSLLLVAAFQNVAADEFLDLKPLLKEVVGSSPGMEMILPLIDEIDNTGDEYPDQMFFKFNVFNAGSTTLLFSTTPRGFVPPAIPCTTPSFVDWEWEIEFLGEDNTHTGLGLLFGVECFDEADSTNKETFKTFFYMADTSTNGGVSWAQAWPWDSLAFELLDWDSDGQDEVVIYLVGESNTGTTNPSGVGEVRTVILNKTDGTPESDRRYRVVRVFP